jgi:hypothetical protein
MDQKDIEFDIPLDILNRYWIWERIVSEQRCWSWEREREREREGKGWENIDRTGK